MEKLMIHVPKSIKARLDALRAQGTSASGFIRHLLTQHFNAPKAAKKSR